MTIVSDFFYKIISRIRSSNIGFRLVKGVFWSVFGAVFSRGLMLVAAVLLARMLGRSVYGEYGMIQSTVGAFGVFAGFGLGLTATKHVAELREREPDRAGRVIMFSELVAAITGGLMAAGLYIFAPWLAKNSINAPHLVGVLRIGAFIVFINALNSAQTGALSGFEAFKTIASVNIFNALLACPLLVSGAYFFGLNGAVLGLALGLLINWVMNYLALKEQSQLFHVKLSFRNCLAESRVLWRFSLPAVMSGAMVSPVMWICNAMLANQPNGYAEMGILTAALTFQTLVLFVSGMLNNPLLSMLSNSGEKTSERLGVINILSSWALGVFTAIPLLCFPEIAQWLFGKGYATHSFKVTFSLVVFCTTILTFKSGLSRVLVSNNLLWWGFLSNAFWAVILIVFSKFLVHWGAAGLAISTVLAYIFNTLIIVPIYFSRNLIPKNTLISSEAGLIWSILCILVSLNIVNANLIIRGAFFLPSILISILAYKKIFKFSNFNK